jgi:HPt (histidine-containing phosphotransfer) domain-containing protein
MQQSLFANNDGLDTDYLDAAYADDAETAATIFRQYLQELPSNLDLLNKSLADSDVVLFRRHIHKQKPGFSYVGLTDVTQKFQELELKCQTKEDLAAYTPEIETVFNRILSSTPVIEKILTRLEA